MRFVRTLLAHPFTQTTRRIVRRTLAVASVILAVVFVLTLTLDLAKVYPGLRELAEKGGTAYLKRSMHIQELSVRLWDGAYVIRGLQIDGLTPTSRPWLTAKEITVRIPARTLAILSRFGIGRLTPERIQSLMANPEVVIEAIEMTDWKMYVEQLPDGRHSFPDFKRGPGGPKRITTTLKYVRSTRGEFAYDDKSTPWSVIARNIDVVVAKPNTEYRGSARFSNGLVSIQDYVPFRADMNTTFKIDGGRVVFDEINLATDGTRSTLKGDVDMAHWPEQMYSITSTIDMPRMRRIFFAHDKFELGGTAQFEGTFHLFKGDVRPDGTTSGGRELKGRFRAPTMFVNDYRFDDMNGSVRWLPRSLLVHDARARLFGGQSQFKFSMEPLGVRGVKPTNTFDATYADVNVASVSDFFEMMGLRLAGTASGHNRIVWPSGGFAKREWTGEVRVDPPPGTTLMTRTLPIEELRNRAPRNQRSGEFSPHLPKAPVPIGGTLTYSLGPEWIDFGPSQIATPTTYVQVEGRTAYGEQSRLPFHVTSSDWQDSDRIFAGMLTALGNRTKAIPVDGFGTFDGMMLGSIKRPRIEGMFAGQDIRAFDVTWGAVTGNATIENSYADVSDVVLSRPDRSMHVAGRFSLGFPRADGGEQINATIRVIRWPVADLKHAFDISDYDVDGTLSGEFKVTGEYERPFGSGKMAITDGVAYGEKFDSVAADVTLEGDRARLDNIRAVKGAGQGTGSASIAWNGTYSFNFEGRNIAVETLSLMEGSRIPLSGVIDFTAGGSGTVRKPQYNVHATIKDFFVADEGIGTVVTDFAVDDELLTFASIDASSNRLAVFGSGTLALNDARDVNLRFNVLETSLDPYIRAFEPRLSPFTTATVSGTVRVFGELSNIDNVLAEATVNRLDMRLFDFPIQNPENPNVPGERLPIRLAFDSNSFRVIDMRLVGQDTELNIAGAVNLHDETITMRFGGGANLRILEGFTRNVSSRGLAKVSAALSGSMRNPELSGSLNIVDGRIRHFSLPHALERINGEVTFDAKGLNLDGVTARLGNGPVTFGGTIGLDGYRPGRIEVTMVGENMTLRYPDANAWLRATVDADLSLEGTVESMTLRSGPGGVTVHDALYTKDFETGVSLFEFGSNRVTSPTYAAAAPILPLTYDIEISAPSTIRAQNNLLRDVTARAELRLVGTYERPALLGNIDLDRGDVFFGGKRYQIRRASIAFNNPSTIDPFFDIEAFTRVRVPGETYDITVTATGPDPAKTMQITSDPSLPDYQLYALLLSDIPPGDPELSQYAAVQPQQQLLRDQLAKAITNLPLSEASRVLQEKFAVDSVQLTTTLANPNIQSVRLDPAARVTLIKRVNTRVYLTYSRSLSSTTRDQVILVEIDQTDQLSWILSRNEDGTYAIDLRVRKTY